VAEWIAPGTVVIPGHGNVLSYDEFLQYRDFVDAAIAAVRASDGSAGAGKEALVADVRRDFGSWESRLVPVGERIRMVRGVAPGGT
jgi:hypothetical protein